MCDQQQFLCVVVIICKNLPSSPSLPVTVGAGGSSTVGGGGAEFPHTAGGSERGGRECGGRECGGRERGGRERGCWRRQSSSMDTISSCAISAKVLDHLYISIMHR